MDITTQRPKVVIIGSGFAGLEAAKHLTDCPADVVLIDKGEPQNSEKIVR